MFIIGLNFELQVLYVNINSAGNSFYKVTDYVKKVEVVRRYDQDKALEKGPSLGETLKVLIGVKGGQHLHQRQSCLLCPPLQVTTRELLS